VYEQGLVRALREGEFVPAALVLIVEVLGATGWKLLNIVLAQEILISRRIHVDEVTWTKLRTPDFLGQQTLSSLMLELIYRLRSVTRKLRRAERLVSVVHAFAFDHCLVRLYIYSLW
jgi:hypothetical protein